MTCYTPKVTPIKEINVAYVSTQTTVKVVGMRAGSRERVINEVYLGQPVTLIPDPENPFDANAIEVHLGPPSIEHDEHTQIGFLPKEVAAQFKLPGPVAGLVSNVRFPPPNVSDSDPSKPIGCDVSAAIGDFRV